MTCDGERVTGYVDGVLDATAAVEVEAHIASCAACRSQADFERELRQRLRELPPIEAREGLEARVRGRLRRERLRWGRVVLPLAASLAFLAFWLAGSAPFVAWELAWDHDHCFGKQTLPASVWSSDPDRVAAWFEAKGRHLPPLPESAGGLELVGGRLCPILDRRVVHLYYAGEKGQLSLYVVPGTVRFDPARAMSARGKAVRMLRSGGTLVALVSPRQESVSAFERAFATTLASLLDRERASKPGPGPTGG